MDFLEMTDGILDGSGEDSRAVQDMAKSLAQQLGSDPPARTSAPLPIRNSPSPGSTANRAVTSSTPNIVHAPPGATATLNGTRTVVSPAVAQAHQFVNPQSVGQSTAARPTASPGRTDAAFSAAMVQKLQDPGMRDKVNRLRQLLGRLIEMASSKDQKFGEVMRELVKKLLVREFSTINHLEKCKFGQQS